jgi:hypothetical protein
MRHDDVFFGALIPGFPFRLPISMQSITDRQLLILQQSAGLWCFSQEAFFWLVVSFRSSARIFATAPRIAAMKADLRLEPFPKIGTAVPLFLATVVTHPTRAPSARCSASVRQYCRARMHGVGSPLPTPPRVSSLPARAMAHGDRR